MSRADLILNELARERAAEFWRQRQRRVLVHRAEHILTPVRTEQAQGLCLASAAAAVRRQSAGEARQIDDRDLDRRSPEIPIVRAEQQPMKPAGAIVGPRG